MKKNMLLTRKILLLTLLALVFTTVMVATEKASPLPAIAQTNSTTTVYLDPPRINGTAIGQNFTINMMIRDADEIHNWGAGMIFNPDLLECTGFKEGEFLKNVGDTLWNKGTIDNTAGVIEQHGSSLLGKLNASGDGRLAFLTFKVKASGVSDLHLRDVVMIKVVIVPIEVPTNILDVYTAVVDTTPHTVVILSNSTGKTGWYHSGFYDHSFNQTLKELSFKVTGPHPGFSNVTIPETLLNVTSLDNWVVIIDGSLLSTGERTATYNGTHYSIYFTYSLGIHEIKITTRVSSTVSITLSSASITLGSNVTINGNITASDPINPQRPNATVTIQSRPSCAINWTTVDTVETDSNSSYTYTWTPATGGTHEVMASWEGDGDTIGDESDVLALIVLYVFKPVTDVYVVIETNSTVAEFNSIPALNFNQPFKQISFNVTSPYGTIGYSNVTIPKTLLNATSLDEWKVLLIDVDPFDPVNRTVTENATHTYVYFTYDAGNHTVQITTRMSSTISLALSSDSIDLGSSVTISGNVTAEDLTMRPNVNVIIQSRLSGDVDWNTLDTVETDENGEYTYAWAPGTAEIYEVMTSWEGDNETIGDKSDVLTLTVMQSSTISIALSSANITFGSSVTISGSINPVRPLVQVAIWYRLSGGAWGVLRDALYYNSSYSYDWTPTEPGAYEAKASWLGDKITHNATSNALTLTAKWTSTISIALSSTEITKGKSVTISGNINAEGNIARADVTVTILYKLNGENWTTLDTVETDENANYTYPWEPEETGTYEVKASWPGDDITFGNESLVLTLEVKEAAAFPLEMIVVAVVIVIIAIAAVAIYFVKFRKSR